MVEHRFPPVSAMHIRQHLTKKIYQMAYSWLLTLCQSISRQSQFCKAYQIKSEIAGFCVVRLIKTLSVAQNTKDWFWYPSRMTVASIELGLCHYLPLVSSRSGSSRVSPSLSAMRWRNLQRACLTESGLIIMRLPIFLLSNPMRI